jgi:hypothetical protein
MRQTHHFFGPSPAAKCGAFAPPAHTPAASSKRQGFILVAVLLLIALATILVVFTSMLSRIERRAVYNSARVEQARQNALFGLDMALAQLQKDLGTDQSVSARADILDTNVGSGYNPSTGVTGFGTGAGSPASFGTPYWTGAWKSYNPNSGRTPNSALQNLDVDANGNASPAALRNWSTAPTSAGRPSATNLRMDWLVSGEPSDHVNATVNNSPLSIVPTTWTPNLVSSTGKPRTGVVVAKNLPDLTVVQPQTPGPTPGPSVNITAPLVPMQVQSSAPSATAPTIGQYAYWVSDEGIKAKVNVGDVTLGASSTSYTQNQLHFLAPQSIVSNTGLLASNTYDLRLPTPPPVGSPYPLLNVTTTQSIGNLSTSLTGFTGSAANQFGADATTYSLGVLSDTRNGGLKRDLTAAFEDTSFQQYNNLLNSCSLTPPASPDVDAQSVFRATGGIPQQSGSLQGSNYLDGLKWRSLFVYYDLYKPNNGAAPYYSSAPSGPKPAGTSTTPPSNITGNGSYPYGIDMRDPWTSSTSTPGVTNYFFDYILPVLIGVQLDVEIEAVPSGTPGQDYLQLEYRPSLVFYNPYSVRLNANPPSGSGLTVSFGLNTNMMSNLTLTYDVTDATGASALPTSPTSIYIPGGDGVTPGTQQDTSFSVDPPSLSYMEPGEIRVFGLDTTVPDAGIAGTKPALPPLKSNSNVSQDFYVAYRIPSKPAVSPQGAFPTTDSVSTMNMGNSMSANRVSRNVSYVNAWPDETQNLSPGGNVNGRYNNGGLPSTGNLSGSWTAHPVSYFENNPYRLVSYYARIKGLVSSLPASTKYVNETKDLPIFMGNSLTYTQTDPSASWNLMELYAQRFTPFLAGATEIQSFPGGGYTDTFWGAASVGIISAPTSGASPQRVVLNDIPTQPMVSLGQYMHMQPHYLSLANGAGQPFAAMGIGGSLPSTEVALNLNNQLNGTQIYWDFSFMANQALFDSYFFSTVPAANTQYTDTTLPYGGSHFSATYVQNGGVLANGRMKYNRKNGVAPTLSALQGSRTAAANLMVDGAFNVNSTSWKAWKALLSSLTGNSLRVWDPLPVNSTSISGSTVPLAAANLLNPIPRFLSTVPGSSQSSSQAVNAPWSGMRSLSDKQVTDLAQQIVQQVKIRGPFLDMADFLNRRLAGTVSENTMGALQNAIENNTTGINQATRALGVTPTAGTNPYYLPPNTAVGMPGDLMQQDLVQAFAPVLTARSDTFVVRCYGEADNPKALDGYGNPKAEARAWGEAVVQRLPEYVDQTDANLYSINSPSLQALGDSTPVNSVDSVNATFGRRFKIVSFRWLNESDL